MKSKERKSDQKLLKKFLECDKIFTKGAETMGKRGNCLVFAIIISLFLSGCKREGKEAEIIVLADHSGSVAQIQGYLTDAGKKIEEYLGYCSPQIFVKVYHFAVNAKLYNIVKASDFNKSFIEEKNSILEEKERKYTLLKNINYVIEDESEKYNIKAVFVISDAVSQPPQPIKDVTLQRIVEENSNIPIIWIKPDMSTVLFMQGEKVENPEISVIAKVLREERRNILWRFIKIVGFILIGILVLIILLLILRFFTKNLIVPLISFFIKQFKSTSEVLGKMPERIKEATRSYEFYIKMNNKSIGIERRTVIFTNQQVSSKDGNIHYFENINIQNFFGSLYVKVMKGTQNQFTVENHSSDPIVLKFGRRQIELERGKRQSLSLGQQIKELSVYLKFQGRLRHLFDVFVRKQQN